MTSIAAVIWTGLPTKEGKNGLAQTIKEALQYLNRLIGRLSSGTSGAARQQGRSGGSTFPAVSAEPGSLALIMFPNGEEMSAGVLNSGVSGVAAFFAVALGSELPAHLFFRCGRLFALRMRVAPAIPL